MRDAMTDMVVLIPGFGGSVLERDGRVLWGAGGEAGAASLLALGDDAIPLLRVEEDDSARAELADGVRATGVIAGTHMLPGVWKIDGYARMPQLLGRLFDVELGRNYHEFAYDWRRDLRHAARALDRTAEKLLLEFRERTGNPDARLVLVAHSMGAIVARYFLEALDGWKHARALVTFGAPFRGTPAALGALTGSAPAIALGAGGSMNDLLRSFTSLHQLLPVYPAVHAGDGDALQRVNEVEIPGLDPARAGLAMELWKDIDEAIQRHNGNPAYREGSYRLLPVVGTAQTTPQSARLVDGRVELLNSYQHRDLSGDGQVPRIAAQPTDAGDAPATLLTAGRHAELQHDDRALSYVLGLFTSLYLDADIVAPPVRSKVGLDVVLEDAVAAGAPIPVRVRPESAEVGSLTATLEHASSGEVVERVELVAEGDRWHAASFSAAAPGIYRVRVAGDAAVQPASDVFEALPASAFGG